MNLLVFVNYVINLIYPNVCGICNKISKEDICPKCKIVLQDVSKIKIHKYNDKYFEKHIYLFKYEGIIKIKLVDYKFNQKSYIYKLFVNFIIKNKKICRFLKSYDIIIAVPIHNRRKRERGYNQSALIAKDVAKYIQDIKYLENVLLKKINNKPQSTKNREARKKNVCGAYFVKNKDQIKNKKIILLDDIYTTGSTVNECAKVLKEAGAKKVDIITIAKD